MRIAVAPATKVSVMPLFPPPIADTESKGTNSANSPNATCTGQRATKGNASKPITYTQLFLPINMPSISAAPITNANSRGLPIEYFQRVSSTSWDVMLVIKLSSSNVSQIATGYDLGDAVL